MNGKYWLTRDDVKAILIACGVALLILAALWIMTSTTFCEETCTKVGRNYHPPYTTHWTTQHCQYRDSKGDCKSYVTVYHHRDHPARYMLVYTDCDSSRHESEVSSLEYERYSEQPATVLHTHARWKKCKCGGANTSVPR